MSNILEVREVRKSYGSFMLNDVTFDLPCGYIMGFIGPNGAGKTTTIKLILNVIKSISGSIKLFGQEDTAIQNENVGVVMDTPLYVDDWKIANVTNIARQEQKSAIAAIAAYHKVLSDHSRRCDFRCFEHSGGRFFTPSGRYVNW